MIKVVYGDEPYLIELEKHRLLESLDCPELNLLRAEEWSDDITMFLRTYPIMDSRKVCILDIEKVGAIDCESFWEYMDSPSAHGELFIRCRSFDTRTKVAKALEKRKATLKCAKLDSNDKVSNFILGFIERAGGRICKEALDEIIKRENYIEADINLFNICNDLSSMLSVQSDIDLELVKKFVKTNEVKNAFAITSMIVKGDISSLYKQADLISESEAIGIIALIMREFRIGWKSKVLGSSAGRISVGHLPEDKLYRGLSVCQRFVDGIKNGTVPSELALKLCFIELVKEVA